MEEGHALGPHLPYDKFWFGIYFHGTCAKKILKLVFLLLLLSHGTAN